MEILNSFVRDSGRKRDPVRFARCCAVSWSGLILDEVEDVQDKWHARQSQPTRSGSERWRASEIHS